MTSPGEATPTGTTLTGMTLAGTPLAATTLAADAPQAVEPRPGVPTARHLRPWENRPEGARLRDWMRVQVPSGFSSWDDWMTKLEQTMHTHPDVDVRKDALDTRRSMGIALTERANPNWHW